MEEPEVVPPSPEELYDAIVFLGSYMEALYAVLRVSNRDPRPTEIEGVNTLIKLANQVVKNVIVLAGIYARQSADAIITGEEVKRLLR